MKEIDKAELKIAYDEFIRNLRDLIDTKSESDAESIEKIENACFDILAQLEEQNEN